jgi:hypothetical protein
LHARIYIGPACNISADPERCIRSDISTNANARNRAQIRINADSEVSAHADVTRNHVRAYSDVAPHIRSDSQIRISTNSDVPANADISWSYIRACSEIGPNTKVRSNSYVRIRADTDISADTDIPGPNVRPCSEIPTNPDVRSADVCADTDGPTRVRSDTHIRIDARTHSATNAQAPWADSCACSQVPIHADVRSNSDV